MKQSAFTFSLLLAIFSMAFTPNETKAFTPSAETFFACTSPSNLRVTERYGTSTKLHWNAGSGAVGYQLQIMNQSNYGYYWKSVTFGNTTTYLATGLTPSNGYYFRVRTMCGTNTWSPWSYWKPFNSGSTMATALEDRTEDVSLSSISIMPNPAADICQVVLGASNKSENAEIAIFDMTGKKVISRNVGIGDSMVDVDVATLQNGMYLLRFTDGLIVQTRKLMVVH